MSEDKERTFETALSELEQLVEKLESGELSLSQSLELYEQGVRLGRDCQRLLDAANKQITLLQDAATDGQTLIEAEKDDIIKGTTMSDGEDKN